MHDSIKNVIPRPWGNAMIEGVTQVDKSVNFTNIIMHYSFLFGLFPQYSTSTPLSDWSIGLEMQFYFIFPLLMWAISHLGGFSVIFTLSIFSFGTKMLLGLYLSPGILGNFPQPSLIFFKLNIFAAGISIALIHFNKCNTNIFRWGALAAVSLYKAPLQLWAVSLLIVFMLLFNDDRVEIFEKILSSRVARFFGETSYSVYLVHPLIITLILYGLFQFDWFVNISPNLRLLIAFALTSIPVYIVSYILYKIIEKNGIELGKKMLFRLKVESD